MRTIDTIIADLKAKAEDKTFNWSPSDYVRQCEFLILLVEDETKKLALQEQEIAKTKVELRKTLDKAVDVKNEIEATDLYREMRETEAKVKQIYEMINISKLQARLSYSQETGKY